MREMMTDNSFDRNNVYYSMFIFTPIFYFLVLIIGCIVFFIFSIFWPISFEIWIIGLFLLGVVVNITTCKSKKKSKENAQKDLITPINDSDSAFNRIIEKIFALPEIIKRPFLFIWRILQLGNAFGPVCNMKLHINDWKAICDHPELSSSEDHDAIIVNVYNRFAQSASLGCGIDKLINFFRESNHPYQVYLCNNRKDLFNCINNPKTIRIWIFGHGDRGGSTCKDGYCLYEDLVKKLGEEARSKEAVYQFHCNPGEKKSLLELLNANAGFVNHKTNNMDEIHEYIEEIINKNRFNERIFLD
jgi:hypothetical protein